MSVSRILLVLAGLLVAAGAVFLVVRGIQGFEGATSPSAGAGEAGVEESGTDKILPEWEDYAHPGESETPVQRPIEGTGVAIVSPFDQSYARAKLRALALRLDGVAPGADALALISGQVMRLGDAIDEFRIVRIDKFGVSLANASGIHVDLGLGMSTAPPPAEVAEAPRRVASLETASPPKFLPTLPRSASRGARGLQDLERSSPAKALPPPRQLRQGPLPFYQPPQIERQESGSRRQRSPSAYGQSPRRPSEPPPPPPPRPGGP